MASLGRNSRVMIFDGYDVPTRTVRFRGLFGQTYTMQTQGIADAFTVTHGDRIVVKRPGPAAADPTHSLIVAGVLSDELWVFDENDNSVFPLKGAKNYSDLLDLYSPELSTSPDVQKRFNAQNTNPLGMRVSLLSDASEVSEKFGVRPGEAMVIYVHSETADVIVVGAMFGCLWVAKIQSPRDAFPLENATTESSFLTLYRVYDIGGTGLSSPRQPTTPRIVSSMLPYRVDEKKPKSAECIIPFGKTVVEFGSEAMSKFGLRHGDRRTATKGEFSGKICTVVGVGNGTLHVHFDGDSKVTLLRNAANANELAEKHGLTIVGVATVTPQKQVVTEPALPDRSSAARSSPAKTRNFWIAGGRVKIDISESSCAAFGFRHGDSLRCGKGPEAGRVFHVAGTMQGLLWVIPEGKERAIPLRHCLSSKDVEDTWRFTRIGNRSMDLFTLRESEPPATPINSPRRSGNFPLTPRQGSNELRSSIDHASPVPIPRAPVANSTSTLPQRECVPLLNLSSAAVVQARNDTIGKTDTRLDTSPRVDTVPLLHSLVDDVKLEVGSMPGTRFFMKAFANFHTGATDPLAFRTFYATKTHVRLTIALEKMKVFVNHHPANVGFNVDSICNALKAEPHLYFCRDL